MKKVIFVCLLTLSVCLSQPAGDQAAPPHISPVATEVSAGANQPAPVAPGGGAQTSTNGATQPPATNQPTATTPAHAAEDPKLLTQKPTEPSKPSTEATPPADHKPVTPTVPTKPTTANETTATSSTPSGVTTEPPKITVTTTTHKPTTPKAAATTVPTLQARGFDGASFVGGIILTLGLIAIGFMGFKYYKAQTERNYHTL